MKIFNSYSITILVIKYLKKYILLTFLHFVKIEGTKSQGCPYCDKCKLVNYKILKDYIIKYNIFIEINCFNLI